MTEKPATYTCEECQGVFEFEPDWGEGDAAAEFAAEFPAFDQADAGIVCDDCYKAIMGSDVVPDAVDDRKPQPALATFAALGAMLGATLELGPVLDTFFDLWAKATPRPRRLTPHQDLARQLGRAEPDSHRHRFFEAIVFNQELERHMRDFPLGGQP